MSIALLLLALAVVGVVAAVAAGRLEGGLGAPVGSSPHRPLPTGPLRADDVEGLRFSLAVRGYRMDEVDAALERLREELAARDEALAALVGGSRGGERAAAAAAGPDVETSA